MSTNKMTMARLLKMGHDERDVAISLLGDLSDIYCWDEFTKFKE
jgi:hypothetical protein